MCLACPGKGTDVGAMRMLLISLMLLLAPPVLAQDAPTGAAALARAMDAVRQRDWLTANRAAARTDSITISTDIVGWHRLRAGDPAASFADYRDFAARNADWPGMPLLRRRGESAIPVDGAPRAVIDWFDGALPTTGHGALRLIEAHTTLGRDAAAAALAVEIWRTLPLEEDARRQMLTLFLDTLAPFHVERLDAMLWLGAVEDARALLPLVPPAWQRLANARIALRQRAAGVDALIAGVPNRLQSHPGLAYERFRWRTNGGRHEGALELLRDRSTSAEALGRPEAWADRRRYYVRDLMRDGALAEAYTIAAPHFLTPEGDARADFADLEWLAGYLALRLGRPGDAVPHFTRFQAAVDTPISLGRAGYWLGRAYSAAGDINGARAAWQQGARYQTSFYGILAAQALGQPPDPALAGGERFPPLAEAPFTASSVLSAGLMLYEAGERALAERFLTHLVESQNRDGAGQLGALALALRDPHLALRIAKRAARDGHVLPDAYYPLHPLAARDLPVPAELSLSIARRESEFDPRVISPAGAQGLMQLMPQTAQSVAEDRGILYKPADLLNNPELNAELGAAYLLELSELFDGNPVLIAAAYNAGPSRAQAWIERFGDPRAANVDILDWIEAIPFRETRNYIMRVTESVPVYAMRLGWAPSQAFDFTAYLKGAQLSPAVPATR